MGSHIADACIAKGDEVVGIDNLIGGYLSNVPSNVEFFNIDLIDLNSINSLFKGVDLVIHAACTAYEGLSVFSPSLIVKNTFQITANVMSACVKWGVPKIVYMSSMARYGSQEKVPFTEDLIPNPQDPYGIAKYSSELLVRNLSEIHDLNYSILVPHNIIGPRQKYDDPFRNVASIMINRMFLGKQPIIYGDGSQRRCFSFMNDVTNPLMQVCNSTVADGLVVNIGPDERFISINQLATIISNLMNFELKPIYVPERPQEVKDANCSAELARKILGYKTTTSLEEGLNELIKYIEKAGPKEFEYHLPLEFITEKTPLTWSNKLI